MKSRVAQINRGTIEYQAPEISFGTDRLTGTLLPGKKLSLDVTVQSLNGVPMHLFFYSHNARVKVTQPLAFGKLGKMSLDISTVGLVPGDQVRGQIEVLYNGGETRLPYEFTVGLAGNEEETASFASIRDFADYADADRKKAVKLFDWKDFPSMPFMQNLKLQGAYHLYHAGTAEDAGLTDFLQASGCAPKDVRTEETAEKQAPAKKKMSAAAEEKWKAYALYTLLIRYERSRRGEHATGEDLSQAFSGLVDAYPQDECIRLFYVYYLVEQGELVRARSEIIRIQDHIQKERLERRDRYALFAYLAGRIQNDAEKTESAKRLTHKYYLDGTQTLLMNYLEYRLNPEYADDPERSYIFLRQCRNKGFVSTVLLAETCLLYEKSVSYVKQLSEFDLQCMIYGLRNRLISEERLFELLACEMKTPRYLSLYMMVLKLGYHAFGREELLTAICSILLQQGKKGPEERCWYQRAADAGLKLPGLYEHYLASLPRFYTEKLPEQMIRYFGLSDENQDLSMEILYHNVVVYYGDQPQIMELYGERIRRFAFRKMKHEEYSVLMVPIFRRYLSGDYLNEKTAEPMLELFYLKRVVTSMESARNMVIYYPQLARSFSFPVISGESIVPVFSEQALIGIEDARGRIHFDPELKSEQLFSDDVMKKQCGLFLQSTLLTELSEADAIAEKGVMSEEDVFVVTDLIRDRRIEKFFRARLYEALIDLAEKPEMQNIDCAQFLLDADFSQFTQKYQTKLLKILIDRELYREAYKRILEYGADGLDDESLVKLAEYMMKLPIVQNDAALLSVCCRLYRNRTASTAVYSFLARHFTGREQDMVTILKVLRKRRQPTYDLVERTMTVCLYVNHLKELDNLFEIYTGEEKQDEQLIRAYLILKCHDYFINRRKMSDACVAELRKQADNLPRIGILAALQYLSESAETLDEADRKLVSRLLEKAVSENVVLECFSKFNGIVDMPAELEGRVYVEYRSDRDIVEAAAVGFILPLNRYFHRTLTQVYPGVFARSFVLYRREWLKFYFSVREKDGSVTETEAPIISMEEGAHAGNSRYEDLKSLETVAKRGDKGSTAELVKSLILKDLMIEEIFGEH